METLAHLIGRGKQLLDLAVDQLTALGELVAGAGGEVLPDAAGLGLTRAAREVAVADQVGQPGVDDVDVELQAVRVAQAVGDLARGQVGQQARRTGGEDAHDRDVLLGLVVDGVAQGGEAQAVVGRGAHRADVIGRG